MSNLLAKVDSGEIGTKAPYGYKKHPDVPRKIIPNVDTASGGRF
ncbi:MAG: hypothetical protein RR387_07375 [Clostridiales bacterium]